MKNFAVCKDCMYFKKIPMSPKTGQCYLNPPTAVMVFDQLSNRPGTASIRPQVSDNDFCSKIVVEK